MATPKSFIRKTPTQKARLNIEWSASARERGLTSTATTCLQKAIEFSQSAPLADQVALKEEIQDEKDFIKQSAEAYESLAEFGEFSLPCDTVRGFVIVQSSGRSAERRS